jgi:hypothetical protein
MMRRMRLIAVYLTLLLLLLISVAAGLIASDWPRWCSRAHWCGRDWPRAAAAPSYPAPDAAGSARPDRQ